MDKSEIIRRLKLVKTGKHLAYLLDQIKRDADEFGRINYGITEKMLRYFSTEKTETKRYRTFKIRKKSGGTREIKAPCRQLDVILTCINIMLKAAYSPSPAAMGFAAGRSVLNNAQAHVGQNYVFNIDLKDFFPSIPQARVWGRLKAKPFEFTPEVASIIAGICCCPDSATGKSVLPQGSPASPLLTNAICDRLDRRMIGVARRFGLHYTRYADDMTFSSMHNVYQQGSEFRKEIASIIAAEGFTMNENKTRLQKNSVRQEVTGLTVNAIANVSRKKFISDLRWILHQWETKGYAEAYAMFYPKYKDDKGYIKKGEPMMENVIGGKLNYLKMIRGGSNEAYQKLAARFEALQPPVFMDSETDKNGSFVYVLTYGLLQFQSLFNTTIHLEVSRKGKLIGQCVIDNKDKIIQISHSTQKELCPSLNSLPQGDKVESDLLESCNVTLCRSKGKNFWLITRFTPRRSYCLSLQNLHINPDDLLTLWEREGFANAAETLTNFIRHSNPGSSILAFADKEKENKINPRLTHAGKNYLINYFLKNKHLTPSQRARFAKLMEIVLPSATPVSNIEYLLNLWEKEGMDAAVVAWQKMQIDSKQKRPGKPAKGVRKKSAKNPFIDDGLSPEILKAIKQEAEEGGSDIINTIFCDAWE